MNGFRSDVEQLAGKAGEFEDHAAHARRVAEDLRRAVESAGRCWGSDEIGRSFAATHQHRAEQALEALEALPGRLDEMGAKFAASAETYRRVEETNVEEFADGRITGRG